MSERTILVPVDFSAASEAALQYAVAFAKEYDAELLILHVADPSLRFTPEISPVEAYDAVQEVLSDVKPYDDTIRYSHRLMKGAPAIMILRTADDEEVEMIVMGTHGRTGMTRLIMGSVAEEVVRKAKCPVLSVRQPVKSPEPHTAAV